MGAKPKDTLTNTSLDPSFNLATFLSPTFYSKSSEDQAINTTSLAPSAPLK